MHRDRWMKASWRLPGTVPNGSDKFTVRPCGIKRHAPAIAGNHMPRVGHAVDLHLQPLHRRIHIANGSTTSRFLTQHVPRLQGLAKLEVDAALVHRTIQGKAKLEVRSKPL